MKERVSIKVWLISLAVFAVVITISSTVNQGDVTYGIVDHQAAATAEKVDEIQTQWREGGVRTRAIIAMMGDLAWIWIYALGAFLSGREFATKRTGLLRILGQVIWVAALVFGVTDYTETILQFVQLLRDMGSDWMAGTAAMMQPIKIAAFLISFFGVLSALILNFFQTRST